MRIIERNQIYCGHWLQSTSYIVPTYLVSNDKYFISIHYITILL
jgi:hypothetical protein